MQKTKNKYISNLFAVCAIMAYIILNQGGYFAGGIISSGLIISLVMLRGKIKIKVTDVIFFVFCIWYLFCSLKPGFDIRYTAKGLLPISCLLFKFLLPDNVDDKKTILEKIVVISFYITVLAILIGVYSSITSMRLRRLTFPFQYANASGIFFGVMFILSRYMEFEWAKKRQYVFFAGLVLTQSVGAIGLTVLAEIFLSRNLKRTLAIVAILLIGAIVLRGRVYQSIGTFIERFLHMYDGFLCAADNPMFGIGAGRWELVKNIYQSGFYDAKEIHSSIVQIAVDSGIIGIGVFALSVIYAIKKTIFSGKIYIVAILMILLHSCLDFTLTFSSMGFLLMLLVGCGEDVSHEVTVIKKGVVIPVACTFVLMFTILSCGMYQIKKLDGINITKRYSAYIHYYDTNILSRKSVKTNENYAKALYATGHKDMCLDVLENMDVLSTDMIILEKGCIGDWQGTINHLSAQPYNENLYKTVFYNCDDESLQKQTKDMLDEAISSMSYLGKILFKFKGEEIL